MTRKKITGTCHICGNYGPLSFEHVPPKKAFNENSLVRVKFKEAMELAPITPVKEDIQQQGMGGYTLCGKCNNDTGSWYGTGFVNWCYQGFEILWKSSGKPTLIYFYHLFPLRILKQILTMFFSANSPEFGKVHPELVKFILNKNVKYLAPQFRFFAYFNIEGKFRYFGIQSFFRVHKGKLTTMSEINYPPYGYVMTLDSDPPDRNQVEITHFSKYGYNEYDTKAMRLPVLPTHLPLPGDYRSKEEIIKEDKEGLIKKGYRTIKRR